MQLYNTLTRQCDPLTSDDGLFRMYICGITPYDTTHLGHAFTFTCFDVLVRTLEFLGYRTLTVQNVTDIDDDILRQARKLGIPWDTLVAEETRKYQDDMHALNVRPPDHFPFASQMIDEIQRIVAALLAEGYAYEVRGSVYYDVQRDPSFGQLARQDYPTLLAMANERGNFPDDPNKRDPLDFVLWQAARPGEPTWDSPWGPGRPGWHIECSAMNLHFLGPIVDIHSGGTDLIFPHHDCEIVQSEHYSGERPFVRYWFHIEMVRLGGEKMSKSLGNMIFVRDLLARTSGAAIRLYLLTHHYRDAWSADDTDAGIAAAEQRLARWQSALTATHQGSAAYDGAAQLAAFRAALEDDLDTPRALLAADTLADAILEQAALGGEIRPAQAALRQMVEVLGVRLAD